MLILDYRKLPPDLIVQHLCGIPLIARTALSSIKAGFKKIIFLVDADGYEDIHDIVEKDIRFQLVAALDNTSGLMAEIKKIGPDVVTFLSGGYLWEPQILQYIYNQTGHSIGFEHENTPVGWRFKVTPSSTVSLYKTIETASPASFPAVTTVLHLSELSRLEEGGKRSAIEKHLLSLLVKEEDGVIAKNINRKISLAITSQLINTNVTPNQITCVVFLIGMLSGPAIYIIGGYTGIVIGSLLYYAAAVLDGCDGELSRLKFLGSARGAWFDTVVDDAVCLSYILSLYPALWPPSTDLFWVGPIVVFFYLLTLLPRYYVMAKYLKSGNYQDLAAQKNKIKTTPGIITFVLDFFERTIFRTDFIPFAALVCALCSYPHIFAACFGVATLFSALESVVTFASFSRKFNTQNNAELHQ